MVNTAMLSVPDGKMQVAPTMNVFVVLKAGEENIARREDVQDCSTRIARDVEHAIAQLRPALVTQDGVAEDASSLTALELLRVLGMETARLQLVIELYVSVILGGWVQHVKQSAYTVPLRYLQMQVLFYALAITATVVSHVKWNVLEEANVRMAPVIVVLKDGEEKRVRTKGVQDGEVTVVAMVRVSQPLAIVIVDPVGQAVDVRFRTVQEVETVVDMVCVTVLIMTPLYVSLVTPGIKALVAISGVSMELL